MPELSQDQILELSRLPTPGQRHDLRCGDCDAPMVLRLGRYGRFYGCSRHQETGCQGSLSAGADGTPRGRPADARTRAARKTVMDLTERWAAAQQPVHRSDLALVLNRETFDGVGTCTFEECQALIEHLEHWVPEIHDISEVELSPQELTIWNQLLQPDI